MESTSVQPSIRLIAGIHSLNTVLTQSVKIKSVNLWLQTIHYLIMTEARSVLCTDSVTGNDVNESAGTATEPGTLR